MNTSVINDHHMTFDSAELVFVWILIIRMTRNSTNTEIRNADVFYIDQSQWISVHVKSISFWRLHHLTIKLSEVDPRISGRKLCMRACVCVCVCVWGGGGGGGGGGEVQYRFSFVCSMATCNQYETPRKENDVMTRRYFRITESECFYCLSWSHYNNAAFLYEISKSSWWAGQTSFWEVFNSA